MKAAELDRVRKMHAAWPWWDGEMIPSLARQFPRRLRASVAKKRAIVPAVEAWLAAREGLSSVEAMPYMTHALACLHSWPRYMAQQIFDPEEISLPTGLLAGFDAFERIDPADETPYGHWMPMVAVVEFDARGGLPSERRAFNKYANEDERSRAEATLRKLIHPKPADLRGRPKVRAAVRKEVQAHADAGLTEKEIAEILQLPLTKEEGKSTRSHAVADRKLRKKSRP